MSSSPIDEADVPVIGTGAGGSAGAGSGSSGSSLGPHSAAAEYSLASPVTSEAGSAASGSPVPDAKEYGTEQHAFEGPEKVLEIDFVPRPSIENDRGCRLITRDQWDTVLTAARASILCSSSNDHLDSYVLSESSLFVYAYKVIIKTCGTTTLLHAVEPLLAITRGLGMEVEWVGYTRKNFEHPADQVFPHSNFNNEVRWLKDHFPEGHAYVLGPITDDHWFIFVADYITRTSEDARDRTLDIMMFDMDPDFSKLFWKDPSKTDAEVTVSSGIRDLMPTATIQEFMFDPCGYSMNALLFDAYYTIHITPESHCSYGSFETNVRQRSYDSLIRNVLSVFRPKRFTLTLFADAAGLDEMDENPFDTDTFAGTSGGTYKLHSRSSTKFEGDYCSFMGNYRRVGASKSAKARSRTGSVGLPGKPTKSAR